MAEVPRSADIVIIGGGVHGASLAYHLARKKAGRVVPIEKTFIASIDGHDSAVRDIIWRRSPVIVRLDYSFARVFARALRRTVRRVITGECLFSGHRETIGNQLFDTEGVRPPLIAGRGHRRAATEGPV